MTAWPVVALGEVAEFKYGKSLPSASRTRGPFAVYGSNGVVGTHQKSLTAGATIVVGRKGSFGEIRMSSEGCWPIDTTYFVDATSTNADLRWLFHVLSSLGLKDLNRAAAVPGLNREDAYRRTLLLPPLPEQRRIAAILDHADALRAKRRQALANLDELTESIFLNMFGDLDSTWPLVSVADIAASEKGAIRTGPFGSQLLHDEFTDSGVAVLGIDNAVRNTFQWSARRYISHEKYCELKRYTVHPKDVLITIMGTCGRCAVVPEGIPVAINTKHLCCITVNTATIRPEFLHGYFLQHPVARRYLKQTAKGAIMAGLNMGIIKALPILLPPIELQRQYVDILSDASLLRSAHETALTELDALFATLQSRAFRGDL